MRYAFLFVAFASFGCAEEKPTASNHQPQPIVAPQSTHSAEPLPAKPVALPQPVKTVPQRPLVPRMEWKSYAAIVRVVDVFIDKAPLFQKVERRQTVSEKNVLRVVLSVSNPSATRLLPFKGWGVDKYGNKASVRDEVDNSYRGVDFGIFLEVAGQADKINDIRPGESQRDVLVFIPPLDEIEALTLTLPGENLGLASDIAVAIPRNQIVGIGPNKAMREAATAQEASDLQVRRAREAERAKEKAIRDAEAAREKTEIDEAKAEAARLFREKNAKLLGAQEARRQEEKAASYLKFAKKLIKDKDEAGARVRLQEIIADFPATPAAKEAKAILADLNK